MRMHILPISELVDFTPGISQRPRRLTCSKSESPAKSHVLCVYTGVGELKPSRTHYSIDFQSSLLNVNSTSTEQFPFALP